jgi:beta-glucuronidase
MPGRMELSGGAPPAADPVATDFLRGLIELAHELDPTRPATLVAVMGAPIEWLALGDVVSLNRYWGWYAQPADLEAARGMLEKELDAVHARLEKPVILTEFGADTLPGNHSTDGLMWSEEFQVAFLRTYLDLVATKDYVAGIHVWNLADFRTSQGILRPGTLNHKGVFTRDREPKMAAHFLRERWAGKGALDPGVSKP